MFATDITNYYEYYDSNNNVKNRIVGLETIIPTLYKYYKEDYTVVFLGTDNKGLPLYDTKTNPELWSGYKEGSIPPITRKYPGINNNTTICSFDVDEETKRHEPWTGSKIDYKNNLDCFLQGKNFIYPDGSGRYYNYRTFPGNKSFVEYYNYKNSKFIETIGEYPTVVKNTFAAGLNQGIRDNKNKRVIVYQLQ